MEIKVNVDTVRAIREGIAVSGAHTVALSQTWLNERSEDERNLLANLVATGRAPFVVTPTPQGVARLLQETLSEQAERAQQEAKRVQRDAERLRETRDKLLAECPTVEAYLDRYQGQESYVYREGFEPNDALLALRAAVRVELDRRSAAYHASVALQRQREERRQALWGAFVEKYLQGSLATELYAVDEDVLANMRERAAAGFLPSDCREVVETVREGFFRTVADLPKYKSISKRDVCECGHLEVGFDTWAADALSAAEFATLNDVEARLQAQYAHVLASLPDDDDESLSLIVEPRIHEGEATCCESKTQARSLYIALTIGARILSRHLAL